MVLQQRYTGHILWQHSKYRLLWEGTILIPIFTTHEIHYDAPNMRKLSFYMNYFGILYIL